ncbi:MAG: hypothetical protein HYX94_12180 [Chloroflexi bacterium]|nr:hypothetical protein [Chloroflexota bacterium]
MSFFDSLFGRSRPVKSKTERLFAMATGYVSMSVKLGLKSTGRAGICFKPVTTSRFDSAEAELKDLLELSGRETKSDLTNRTDSYGYRWILLTDEDFEDLVATMHLVSQTLHEHGFGEQLLAGLFQFRDRDGRQLFWIYNYKRGSFYPFIPTSGKQRDSASELRLRAVMEKEMPVEPEMDRWFPLWDIPLNRV